MKIIARVFIQLLLILGTCKLAQLHHMKVEDRVHNVKAIIQECEKQGITVNSQTIVLLAIAWAESSWLNNESLDPAAFVAIMNDKLLKKSKKSISSPSEVINEWKTIKSSKLGKNYGDLTRDDDWTQAESAIINEAMFYIDLVGTRTEERFANVKIIARAAKTQGVKDPRHLAYILATAWHESGFLCHTEQKTPAGGRQFEEDPPGSGLTYEGRGFGQLTWRVNYQKMNALFKDIDLVANPELALRPDIAAKVLVVGMVKGMFRAGHDLSTYIHGSFTDYYNARDIINTDKNVHTKKGDPTSITIGQNLADIATRLMKYVQH